jgi:hypothetical protein
LFVFLFLFLVVFVLMACVESRKIVSIEL